MKLFITAGEPSGDALGAALIAGLKELVPDLELRGIAGPRMQAAGMESLFPMEELSVMGLAEVLPKYFALKRRIAQTAEACADWAPDALITIDSPDFSLRVARLVRDRAPSLRTMHYVAPTVWAWRPERAAKMAPIIDHVLALFPFEPPYMTAAGMTCDFVGHPVATVPPVTEDEKAAFRAEHGLSGPLLVLLPGSRKSEVARLMPVLAEALRQSPQATWDVVLPTLPHLSDAIREMARDLPKPPVIIDGKGRGAEAGADARRVAMATADLALAASGTVSLELAAARTPMVIIHDMNWISRVIISRKILIDTVTLVNLVSETRTIPEFLGRDCRPELIAPALAALGERTADQLSAMDLTMERLGQGAEPPGLRAARSVLAHLEAK
ncbi:MAG: lipid-A-disaccharide synthase [Pseudomonadota bacterium]